MCDICNTYSKGKYHVACLKKMKVQYMPNVCIICGKVCKKYYHDKCYRQVEREHSLLLWQYSLFQKYGISVLYNKKLWVN